MYDLSRVRRCVEVVVLIFRWQRLVDARGATRVPCWMRNALRCSGYSRAHLVRRGESGGFWVVFMLTIFAYVVSMVIGDQILMPIFGFGGGIEIGSFFDLFWFLFPGITAGIVMGIFNTIYGWRSAEHAIGAMTRAGLCPACAYRIDDCQPEADGCTVCPECGAAWRMPL